MFLKTRAWNLGSKLKSQSPKNLSLRLDAVHFLVHSKNWSSVRGSGDFFCLCSEFSVSIYASRMCLKCCSHLHDTFVTGIKPPFGQDGYLKFKSNIAEIRHEFRNIKPNICTELINTHHIVRIGVRSVKVVKQIKSTILCDLLLPFFLFTNKRSGRFRSIVAPLARLQPSLHSRLGFGFGLASWQRIGFFRMLLLHCCNLSLAA